MKSTIVQRDRRVDFVRSDYSPYPCNNSSRDMQHKPNVYKTLWKSAYFSFPGSHISRASSMSSKDDLRGSDLFFSTHWASTLDLLFLPSGAALSCVGLEAVCTGLCDLWDIDLVASKFSIHGNLAWEVLIGGFEVFFVLLQRKIFLT